MPARKSFQVPTLQDLCFTLISSNIDFWCNEEHYVDVNPLAKLPNVMLDEICKRTMRGDRVRPHHLNTLVHQNTTDLELYDKPAQVVQRGIELIQNVCTNLTSLNLCGCRISEDCLVELMKSIPKIQILNLQTTKAKDKVLKILGENCPDLRELNLCDTEITDAGIKELCKERPAKDGGQAGGRCRLIHELLLWDAHRITDEGQATALRNLPCLRRIINENTLTPIEILYRENSNYQLKLEKIDYLTRHNVNVSPSTIDAAVALCKNVKKLYFSALTDNDRFWLPRLANFSHVEELTLIGFDPAPSFHECVAPILQGLGSALKKLIILSFDGVNLWEIGEYNTNLEELVFSVGDGRYPTVIPRPRGIRLFEIFTEIREIYLCSNNRNYRIPGEQIETLLSNCSKVQSLAVCHCDSLTDRLLRRVCDVNSFSELHTLDIHGCNNIHVSSILMFMNTSKVLRRIRCCRNRKITRDDIRELRNIARNENFDLEITRD